MDSRVVVAGIVLVAVVALLAVRGRVSMISSFFGTSFRLFTERSPRSIEVRRVRSGRDIRLSDHGGNGISAVDVTAERDVDVLTEYRES